MKTPYSNSNKYFLFTPGPVNVEESVRTAIGKEGIGHREADFDILLQSIEKKLLQLFEIRETNDYQPVVITGSGTAAKKYILSPIRSVPTSPKLPDRTALTDEVVSICIGGVESALELSIKLCSPAATIESIIDAAV